MTQYQIQGDQNKMLLVKNPCLNTFTALFSLKYNKCDMCGRFRTFFMNHPVHYDSVSKFEFENWFSSNKRHKLKRV